MPAVASRVRLVLAAAWVAASGVACQGSDPFYRNRGSADGAAGQADAASAGDSGAAGASASGAAGASDAADAGDGAAGLALVTPCTTCMVGVNYTCRSNDTGQASFVLDVTNEGTSTIELARLTLRYWYTIDVGKAQELDCDVAKLGCTNVVTSADVAPAPRFVALMPPRIDANEYAEIAFLPGALALDPTLDTGDLQLRLHNKDFSTIDQTDDYSFDCSMKGDVAPTTKITAYVDDVLVGGTEPP